VRRLVELPDDAVRTSPHHRHRDPLAHIQPLQADEESRRRGAVVCVRSRFRIEEWTDWMDDVSSRVRLVTSSARSPRLLVVLKLSASRRAVPASSFLHLCCRCPPAARLQSRPRMLRALRRCCARAPWPLNWCAPALGSSLSSGTGKRGHGRASESTLRCVCALFAAFRVA